MFTCPADSGKYWRHLDGGYTCPAVFLNIYNSLKSATRHYYHIDYVWMSGGSWTVFEIIRIADLHVPQFLLEYLQLLKTCYAT